MKSALPRGTRRLGLVILVMAGILLWSAAPARALTPESPEVVAVVEKACGYLEKHARDEGRPGGKALVGLTFLKAGKPDHPAVQQALAATQQHLAQPVIHGDVYMVALMLVFLCELPKDQRAGQAALFPQPEAPRKAL